ncbi:hypothetical protein K438DRAFT_1974964 [Mycena galopus ATCC 62051]|nr:hypothetical protein K438DRAFT_1974964 [Mycena galopus ATCC 62051]
MSFPPVFKQPPATSIVEDTTKPRTVTMPQLPTPTNDVPIGVDVPLGASALVDEQLPTESNYHTPPADSKLIPPTPSLRVSPALPEVSDNMGDIWRSINNRNISETEKMMNEINYMASGVASSSDGVIGFVKSEISDAATSSSESVDGFVEDVTVKTLGNAILEGVPGIMSALEALTDIHPFLKAAFLPFKLIYEQETKRRDNDQRRTTLFGKIKEVMQVLLDLKDIKKNDTTRTTPDNQPVLGRLESICKTMEREIKECYNVLNAQERRRLAIKFLRAANWNKELGLYASRFVKRREELLFALSMRTVNTTEEIKADMMEMFAKILTPQEREMGRWIRANGGQQAVLKDDKLCAEMLKQEALVFTSTGIKYEASAAASSGPVGSADKGRPGANEDPKIAAKAVAALRKEYHDDIQAIIQENLESYSKRFDMGLEDLGQDLGKKIQHEGDRLIRYLRGGPHQRIKDKFKNYWEWGNGFQLKYFTENDTTVWTSDTIGKMEPSQLEGILAYTDTHPLPLGWEERRTPDGRRYFLDYRTRTWIWLDPRRDGAQAAVVDAAERVAEITPKTDSESLEEHISIEQMTGGDSNTVPPKPYEAEITGTWSGFHWTQTQQPFHPMLSFTVRLDNYGDRSESETIISGDGVAVQGNSFRLSGTMNSHLPAENPVVNFARIYTDDGTQILYHGCFQPDRGLMTGTFIQENASGSFLFKKVPTSAIMCARPMVPKLTAKELWSFALNAVLNDIRRKKPNLLYIRERMTAIRRVFEFMYHNNDSLKQVEDAKLIKTFSVEEMTELLKLYNWYLRAGGLQPYTYICDGCGGPLIRSRVICLDCMAANTVDFCSRPECIASERVPDRPGRPDIQHSACHLMVCLRDLFLLKDYFAMKQRAKYTLDYARFLYKDDLSLTLPLPASPIADSSTSSEAKGKVDLNIGIQTSASVILDNDPTPTPVPIAPRAPLGLPALDTVFLKSPAGDSSSSDSPSPDTPTLAPREFLSVAVTPVERRFQDMPWNCVVCHERVVAPCWSCVTCQNNAWVCDSCEKITNELSPWDYQKRYRSEVQAAGGTDDESSHTVLHHMVRLARVNIREANPDVNKITVESTTTKVSSPLGQWEEVEKRIQELTARFEALNTHVDQRLNEVEAKLSAGFTNVMLALRGPRP